MITCNSCGKLTNEGFGHCQYCGAPLGGMAGSGVDPRMGASELPAWLESLRAGALPAESSGEQFNYNSQAPVDKDALPSWMLPESAEQVSADQRRRSATLSAPNTDGTITAHSLIDEQALPSWIRGGQPAADLSNQRNISAASLVQSDAVPQWMRTVQQSTPVPPKQPTEPGIPPQGITGNSLIDPQAVPTWMSGQSGPTQPIPPSGGISAGSLVDSNALPNWLRENGQGQPPRAEINSPARPGQVAGTNANISASSLVDANALPDWLRAGANQGQGQEYGQRPQEAPPADAINRVPTRSFNVPPRVENMRVPSRPRGEMGPREQSEVAANVFASMLGVASPVPNFPPPSTGGMTGYPPQGQSQMGSRDPIDRVPPMYPGNAGSAPMGNSPIDRGSAMGPGSYQGYQAGYSMLGVQQPGVPQQPPGMAASGHMEPNAKTPKRGFLETIRGWFSR